MLLFKLWNYIRGYVIIVVEGYFLEKFINICIHRQIYLWDMKRQKHGSMTLKVSINGFRLLRPVARKTTSRVRIYSKRGLPFVMNRYKKRKFFIAGAIVFAMLFYVLSSFIWTIELSGNSTIASSLIMAKLAEYEVKPGILKYNVDTEHIVSSLMLDIKELAWVGVSVKGTKVKVEIEERVKPRSLISGDSYCNIVAYRGGLVKSVIARVGQQMVKPGDTVVKGQVLISGTVVSKNEEVPPRPVHASGEVTALTWYEKSVPLEDFIIEKHRTGRVKSNYTIRLFNNNIHLFHKEHGFKDFDKTETVKQLSIGQDLVFPFSLVIDRFFENNIIEKELTFEEAKQNAAEKAYAEISERIPEKAIIVKKEVKYIENADGTVSAELTVECLEDIGVEEGIGE